VRTERLIVTPSLSVDAPKTRLLAAYLKSLALENVLIIIEAPDEKLTLAARNLPHVELLSASAINPVSLVRHDKVLATVGALKLIEERLQ
jgi:large subunit ribosomal protein L4